MTAVDVSPAAYDPNLRQMGQTVYLICGGEPGWPAVRAQLARLPGLRVIEGAEESDAILRAIATHRPNLVIAPLFHGPMPYAPLLIAAAGPSQCTRLVLIADRFARADLDGLGHATVGGSLEWRDLGGENLALSLTTILHGLVVNSPGAIEAYRANALPVTAAQLALSPMHLGVLRRIANDRTRGQIASELHVSKRTVDRQVRELLDSLGVEKTHGLVKRATELGLVP